MQKHSTFNYVRTLRKRHALTEDELAFLCGQRSGTAISKIETGRRVPTLRGAFALHVVFGLSPADVFPEFYEYVEDAVMRRAWQLYERLEGKADRRSVAKRELLDAMASRKETNSANA